MGRRGKRRKPSMLFDHDHSDYGFENGRFLPNEPVKPAQAKTGFLDDDRSNDNQMGFQSSYSNKGPSRLPDKPSLQFTPYAWAKLTYLRDIGNTEVGGYLLMADESSLLCVDIIVPKQTCSVATVKFDDESIAFLGVDLTKKGYSIKRWRSFWVHTHPGDSPLPSGTDEETFREIFGNMDYALMFILAKGGAMYSRLRYNQGPGLAHEIETFINYKQPFAASDWESWKKLYDDNVNTHSYHSQTSSPSYFSDGAASTTGSSTWWARQQELLGLGRDVSSAVTQASHVREVKPETKLILPGDACVTRRDKTEEQKTAATVPARSTPALRSRVPMFWWERPAQESKLKEEDFYAWFMLTRDPFGIVCDEETEQFDALPV